MVNRETYVLYKSGIEIKDKWLKIIQNHCDLYNPLENKKAENNLLSHGLRFKVKEGVESEILSYYLCPLCVSNFVFIKDDEIHWSNEFDMDHFPPKSANGRKSILVCKECNSRYGRNFDFAIESYLKFNAFLNRKSINIHSKLSLNNVVGKYSTQLGWEGNVLVTNIDFKKYPLLKAGFLDVPKKIEDFKINFTLPFPNQTSIHKAFLKAAYLNCFSIWGYDFALSSVGRNIVKVLDDKIEHPLTNMGVFKDDSQNERPEGLYMIEEPKEFECFMYICSSFQKEFAEKTNTFVLIPKLKEDSWLKFKEFQKLIPEGELVFKMAKVDKYGVTSGHYHNFSRFSEI